MKYKLSEITHGMLAKGKVLILIPSPGRFHLIKLCEDGKHYEILRVSQMIAKQGIEFIQSLN